MKSMMNVRFNYDEHIIKKYSKRYCKRLAERFNIQYGWSVYAILTNTDIIIHYTASDEVEFNSERLYVDIIGIFTKDDILKFWQIQRPDVIVKDIVKIK